MGDSHNSHDQQLEDKRRYQIENERRIEALVDLVEKHTRTRRHLEQHSDITDLDQLQHTFKVQEEREKKIDHLKNIIVYGKHEVDDIENLERNYRYTNNYLKHHETHMDDFTLEKTMEKQENRLEQMESISQNKLY